MNILIDFFNTTAGWYGDFFSEWMHIHFGIRTFILLLCVWAAVFIAAQIFKYLIGPLSVLFFCHVIFRAWNFIFVETFQELIYIHFYSREKKFLSETYLKLCDKIKKNRLRLEHTRYKGILFRGTVARAARRLMIIFLIIGTLWVAAFGLYYEYAYSEENNPSVNGEQSAEPPATFEPQQTAEPYAEPETTAEPLPTAKPAPQPLDPAGLFWAAGDILYLNEYGADGANIRDKPDSNNSTVVEVVWGEAEMENLNEYYGDASIEGLVWVKVRTAAGTEGYISSKLLKTEN